MNISNMLCDLYDIKNMATLHGFGNLPKDNEGTELNVKVYKDEVDKLIKEYKRIKKFKKSNLGQVQKLGLVDKHGKPL